ncbi:MAG: hypothetical protein GY866_34470 [Proteobacteria bacterium]|nr:hypothetical protein [Pseudomonadota bacterium]
MVSIRYGLKGPLSVPSVACSAGSNTIGESLDHALSRGTEIYAEIAGYGNTADAHHFTAIAAGGIYDGEDIVRMLALGASGVQMGTRFVCCRECGVSEEFKEAYLNAEADDIAIVKSPVGMPGRAIRNRFVEEIEASEKTKIKCPHKCLSACKIESAKFCIAKALFNAYSGDVDHGLIFCGENAHRIDKITTVKELFEELLEEFSQKHKAA